MAPPSRGVGLAVLLSLAAHGVLALVLLVLQAAAPATGTAFAEDDCRDLTLTLADASSPRVPTSPRASEEEQGAEREFEVKITEANAAAPFIASAAPSVVGIPATGQTSAGAAGTPTPATGRPALLEAPAAARSVVYVVDRSLSMGVSGALDRARRELLAGLDRLPTSTRVQVIFYNRQAAPLHVRGQFGLLPWNDATRAAVTQAVASLQASGSTDHGNALRQGLLLRPDVLYLVTDADDLQPEEVRKATLFNGNRTTIHAVELNAHRNDRIDGPLRRLAALNRGTYRCVPPVE